MKWKKKAVFMMALVSLVVSLVLIQETYAKYQVDGDLAVNMSVARWNISVNNQDITTNSYVTNTVQPIFSGNAHVKEGFIAPRSEGYFDVLINTSNVDVSFRYNISTSVSASSDVMDLKIIGYSINGSEIIETNGSLNNLSNTILYNSGVTNTNLRIYIAWDDSSEAVMSNADDTAPAINNGRAKLDVLLSFVQITN